METAPDITLLISTYNKPEYLALVLEGVRHQHTMPAEVVVADDGSDERTRRLLQHYKELLPVPLIHSWIPDEGYRLTKALNEAIAKASKPYIVRIDGDIVMSPHFIADHDRLKERGFFVAGSRAYLSPKATAQRLGSGRVSFHFFSAGLKRRFVMLHLPLFHPLLKGRQGLSRARGCHLAFWRDDCIAVNGFEELFQGWSPEDSEFVQRLYNHGVQRHNAKLMAPAVHLWHEERGHENIVHNREILQQAIDSHKLRAERGIDQYLLG